MQELTNIIEYAKEFSEMKFVLEVDPRVYEQVLLCLQRPKHTKTSCGTTVIPLTRKSLSPKELRKELSTHCETYAVPEMILFQFIEFTNKPSPKINKQSLSIIYKALIE
jgi:hypothetical protein